MSDPRKTKAGGAASPLHRRSLAPERLPEFPPRSAADVAAVMRERRVRVEPPRRRGGLALGILMAVLATAAGAGAVIGLDPLPPPEQAELARLVASAEPRETRLPAAAPQAESAPAVVHTGALVTPPPNPEIAPPPVPEPAVVAVPVPLRQPEAATAAEPTSAPAVIASVAPEPEVAREPEGAPDPVPQVQADLSTAFPATVKPAELNGLVSKGEQFLKAGDLASARLFFERAANAGDSRGAYGMAQSYDPAVVRKLPVYGLAVDGAEADRWYAKARALDSVKAFAQP